MGGRVKESRIELRTSSSDTNLNNQFSQKLKPLLYGKFNPLITYFKQNGFEFFGILVK